MRFQTHPRVQYHALKRRHSSLPYWLPWSECTSTGTWGLRRHTAMSNASSASSLASVGFIDQPTILREYRSTNHRQIEPSLPSAQVGDVGNPGLIRPLHGEGPIERVGRQDRGPAGDVPGLLIAT